VTGRRIVRSTFAELGARGAGALALVAVGAAPDLPAALAQFGDDAQTFEPDPCLRALHDAQAQVFRDVRDAVRHHWPDLRATQTAAHAADAGPASASTPTLSATAT